MFCVVDWRTTSNTHDMCCVGTFVTNNAKNSKKIIDTNIYSDTIRKNHTRYVEMENENRFMLSMLSVVLLTVTLIVSMVVAIDLCKCKIIADSEQPVIMACILGSDVENLKECHELSK